MRLIDGDEVKKVIDDSVSQYGSQYSADMLNMWALFSHIINEAPTVEITEEQAIDKLHETGWLPLHDKEMTERPHGKWIPTVIDTGFFERSVCREWKCSNCGEVVNIKYPFCHCGADMRKEAENDTP